MEKEEKKKLLEEKSIHLWFKGSPVALCSMKLELDMSAGAIFAYGKFLNVQPENIKTMTFDIICYDAQRNVIDRLTNCSYDDMDIPRNGEFGMEMPIRIKNEHTRNLEFVIQSVTTTSGQVWYNFEDTRFNISLVQESIFNVQKDLHKQFIDNCTLNNIDHTKLIFHPVFDEIYWLCACGTFNWSDEDICCCCGVRKHWLIKNVQPELLEMQNTEQKSEAEKIREEAAERERLDRERQKQEFEKRKEVYANQQKKSENKKRNSKALLILFVAILLGGGLYAGITYGIPYLNYNSAVQEYNNGNYDSARQKFEGMKDYLDSEEMIKKCIYGKAESSAASGNKQAAAELFQSILDYSDSEVKYYDTLKSYADDLYNDTDYRGAITVFREIERTDEENYQNSQKKIYVEAEKKFKHEQYKNAMEDFEFIDDYKDSAEKARECLYMLAKYDYESLKYRSALDRFNTLKGYKDVDDILKKIDLLSKVISAADSDGAPAVWNCYDVKCPTCGSQAEYVFEFYENGKYNFSVVCENESEPKTISGRYKIENNTLYDAYYVDGNIKWKKMVEIKSFGDNVKDVEGKNVYIVMGDPINKKNKTKIKIFGNIISDDTVSLG